MATTALVMTERSGATLPPAPFGERPGYAVLTMTWEQRCKLSADQDWALGLIATRHQTNGVHAWVEVASYRLAEVVQLLGGAVR